MTYAGESIEKKASRCTLWYMLFRRFPGARTFLVVCGPDGGDVACIKAFWGDSALITVIDINQDFLATTQLRFPDIKTGLVDLTDCDIDCFDIAFLDMCWNLDSNKMNTLLRMLIRSQTPVIGVGGSYGRTIGGKVQYANRKKMRTCAKINPQAFKCMSTNVGLNICDRLERMWRKVQNLSGLHGYYPGIAIEYTGHKTPMFYGIFVETRLGGNAEPVHIKFTDWGWSKTLQLVSGMSPKSMALALNVSPGTLAAQKALQTMRSKVG